MTSAGTTAASAAGESSENTEKTPSVWLQAKKSRANLRASRVCFSVLGLLGSPSLLTRDRKKVVGLDDEHVLAADSRCTRLWSCGPSVERIWIERQAH